MPIRSRAAAGPESGEATQPLLEPEPPQAPMASSSEKKGLLSAAPVPHVVAAQPFAMRGAGSIQGGGLLGEAGYA